MINELSISGYRSKFILGNNESEKNAQRCVILNIWIRFPEQNHACTSDNLEHTVCYSSLLEFLNEKLNGANFNLIERATKYVYDQITEFIHDENVMKKVELIKENPINELQSASFICSDW